jgi:hypothetical protein
MQQAAACTVWSGRTTAMLRVMVSAILVIALSGPSSDA